MSGVRARWTLLVALSLLACGPGLPEPTAAHLALAQQRDPSTTLADLSRGRASYVAKCGGCHALREPASQSPSDWPRVVAEMQEKQGVRLTPQENHDILRYLDATTRLAQP